MSRRARIGWIAALAALAVPGAARAQQSVLADTARFEYAVKVVCGVSPALTHGYTPPVTPGLYATSINIHNPRSALVRFQYKVAATVPGAVQGPVSGFFPASLERDLALRIDCPRIAQMLPVGTPTNPVDAFVVIQTPLDLDVVAVYTAAATGTLGWSVSTMHVECVPPRRTLVPPGANGPIDTGVIVARGPFCQ